MPSSFLRYKERKEHDLLTDFIDRIIENEQDIIKKEKTSSCPIHKCALWSAKVFATVPFACISAFASTKVFGYIGSIYGHVDERSTSSELKVKKESKRYFASLWAIGSAASYSVLSALDGPSVHYFHQQPTQPSSLKISLDDSNPFNDILHDLDELDSCTLKRRVIFVSTANKNFLEVLGANPEQALSHFGTLKEAFTRHQVDNVFFKGCFFSSVEVAQRKSIAELFISTFGEVSEITFEDCIFENTHLLTQENIRNKYKLLGPRLIVQKTTPSQEPNGITVLFDSKELAEGFAGKLKGEIEIFLDRRTLMESTLDFNLVSRKKYSELPTIIKGSLLKNESEFKQTEGTRYSLERLRLILPFYKSLTRLELSDIYIDKDNLQAELGSWNLLIGALPSTLENLTLKNLDNFVSSVELTDREIFSSVIAQAIAYKVQSAPKLNTIYILNAGPVTKALRESLRALSFTKDRASNVNITYTESGGEVTKNLAKNLRYFALEESHD